MLLERGCILHLCSVRSVPYMLLRRQDGYPHGRRIRNAYPLHTAAYWSRCVRRIWQRGSLRDYRRAERRVASPLPCPAPTVIILEQKKAFPRKIQGNRHRCTTLLCECGRNSGVNGFPGPWGTVRISGALTDCTAEHPLLARIKMEGGT